jgi:GT2 family glycosyltransferase
MMVRKQVFEKIGFLDERFFLYYEDADFSSRSKKAGFENLIVPDAKIEHMEKSENNSEKKIYWLVLSGLIFFRNNSAWPVSLWHNLYLKIRKLKNRLDIARRENRIDLAVAKAYLDFEKHGR